MENMTTFLEPGNHLHFTGIKGVGMTALALCAQDFGLKITGSDIPDQFVTDAPLRRARIKPALGFESARIQQLRPDAVVFTAAHLGEENPEVKEAKRLGIPVLAYAEALGEFMKLKRGISVCGVGGKSTVSAMIAVVLETSGVSPAFAVGVGNISVLGVPGKWGNGEWFVAETDEYTTSPQDKTPKMMYQHPEIIVLPNLEFDHPDVYRDFAATRKVFLTFINQLPKAGLLVAGIDNPHVRQLIRQVKRPVVTYGFSRQADWVIQHLKLINQRQQFTVRHDTEAFPITLPLPGRFNAANATAALIVAARVGVGPNKLVQALSQFTGTKRRFEKIFATGSTVLYDDYAHHPLEITATLGAAKAWLPGKKILAIFQPHTFSRTKALLPEFALSFGEADEVVITDIYASARETEDLGMSGKILAEEVKKHHKNVAFCPDQAAVVGYLGQRQYRETAIFTLGAGDIFLWHQAIRRAIQGHDQT